MPSRGASRLFSTLKSNKHIKLWNLDISNNDIGDQAVNDITQFLMENNVLKHLHIDNNKFTEQGIIKILKSLHSKSAFASLFISKRFNNDQMHAEKNKLSEKTFLSLLFDNDYFCTCTICL